MFQASAFQEKVLYPFVWAFAPFSIWRVSTLSLFLMKRAIPADSCYIDRKTPKVSNRAFPYATQNIRTILANIKPVMDDETAKQRLDALLATAGDVKDLAEFFYKHHPTPEELQAVHNEETSREIERRCRTLVEALRVLLDRGMTRYKDRTFSIIWQTLIDDRSATTEAAIYPLLQNGLALLAMHRRRLIDWQSAQAKKGEMLLSKKAKLLEYMLWIVQGRKDEDSPLETGVCELLEKGTNCPSLLHTTRANRIDGDCVRCGKPGSRLRCRNCKICVKKGKDEYQVFGIYYCTLECHVADQERHEQTCKGVVALHRGAEMFTKLYVLTLQHCHEKVLTDIYSQGSVVTAKYGTLDERGYLGSPLFAEFPSGGSLGSAEVTLAVLTHGHCREVFITGRLLFEMLMRRKFMPFSMIPSDTAIIVRVPTGEKQNSKLDAKRVQT